MLHLLAALAQTTHHITRQSLALGGLRRASDSVHGQRTIAHAIAYLEGSMPLQATPDERVRSRQEAVALLLGLHG